MPFTLEVMEHPKIGTVVNGEKYDPYLNGHGAAILAAREVHTEVFLRDRSEEGALRVKER